MTWFKDKYNLIFSGFLLSVLVVFFCIRPLNTDSHKFIAGDGLGYYAYLPAKFIFNDPGYDFKWFNKAHNANYVYSAFENPEQNLLVEYKGKRINKFYQGLAYIWFPFFAMGHVCAKLLHYPPDGFSAPYQLFIGLASLFYLFLGLIYLRKLIQKLFNHSLAALCIPIVFFYGTHLFTYAIKGNSLSHAYSFTFITLFLYFLVSFFKAPDQRLRFLLLCILCLVVTASIRPLNVLILLIVPAFVPRGFFKEKLKPGKFGFIEAAVALLILGAVYYQVSITYIQTNSFIAYTYTDEKFYFGKSKFFEALFSYHIGLYVYVPLMFLSLFGIPFLTKGQRIILPLFFFLIVFIYASWWYWPILKRALIDFYAIPAICLGALISNIEQRRWQILFLSLTGLSTIYFQFKNFQVNTGILEEYTTYKEVFWRNFFRTTQTNMYLVEPSTIIKQKSFNEDFENSTFTANLSSKQKVSGKKSLSMGPQNYICKVMELPYPDLFNEQGPKKVRFSFKCYFTPGVKTIHAFIQFYDKDKKMIFESPYYVLESHIHPGKWDSKEFGLEIDNENFNSNTVDKIGFTIWNVEAKKEMFIDDVKVEFLLTDRSFEITK